MRKISSCREARIRTDTRFSTYRLAVGQYSGWSRCLAARQERLFELRETDLAVLVLVQQPVVSSIGCLAYLAGAIEVSLQFGDRWANQDRCDPDSPCRPRVTTAARVGGWNSACIATAPRESPGPGGSYVAIASAGLVAAPAQDNRARGARMSVAGPAGSPGRATSSRTTPCASGLQLCPHTTATPPPTWATTRPGVPR